MGHRARTAQCSLFQMGFLFRHFVFLLPAKKWWRWSVLPRLGVHLCPAEPCVLAAVGSSLRYNRPRSARSPPSLHPHPHGSPIPSGNEGLLPFPLRYSLHRFFQRPPSLSHRRSGGISGEALYLTTNGSDTYIYVYMYTSIRLYVYVCIYMYTTYYIFLPFHFYIDHLRAFVLGYIYIYAVRAAQQWDTHLIALIVFS